MVLDVFRWFGGSESDAQNRACSDSVGFSGGSRDGPARSATRPTGRPSARGRSPVAGGAPEFYERSGIVPAGERRGLDGGDAELSAHDGRPSVDRYRSAGGDPRRLHGNTVGLADGDVVPESERSDRADQ